MPLTRSQNRILEFLKNHQTNGLAMPTIQEITEYCRYASTRATRDHLDALERKGKITRTRGKARSLRVIDEPLKMGRLQEIPVLGSIPAGFSEEVFESLESTIQIDVLSFGLKSASGLFALKVRGNSMVDRGILEGDLAIVDSNERPSIGNVVVALVDGEVTLKTIVKNGQSIYLKAENPDFDDIFPLRSLQIQGVVKSIVRTQP